MSELSSGPLFAYMRWAKGRGEGIRYNLGQSGLAPDPATLTIDGGPFDLSQRAGDMPPEAREAVAERFGIAPERVMLTLGSSQALHLLCATHIKPGSCCFVESPAYEALPGLVRLLGGELRTVPRRFESAYALPDDLPARIEAERPAIVLLTNPHNPSGVHLDADELEVIARAATDVGSLLVIDEVYLEFLADVVARSASRLKGNVAVVSSLTKAYGLGTLRFGWILANEDIIERAIRYNDFVSVVYPNPSAHFGLAALGQIEALSRRAQDVRAQNVPLVESWMASREDLSWCLPDVGVVGFPKIDGLDDTRDFCDALVRDHQTLLVPGHFFGAPSHVRLGFGAPREELEAGLERFARGLDALR